MFSRTIFEVLFSFAKMSKQFVNLPKMGLKKYFGFLREGPFLLVLRFAKICTSAVWMGLTLPGGRLSILLDLVRDEHGLLSGGCQACLPGKFGYEVSDAVMPACMKAFGATCGMSAIRGQECAGIACPPGACCHTVVPFLEPGVPAAGLGQV